jgi:preprotein translocase subunit SecE
MADSNTGTAKKGFLNGYFKGVKSEFKKVVWPTRNETYKYTVVVLVICALFALFFWLVDTGCLLILKNVLGVIMG